MGYKVTSSLAYKSHLFASTETDGLAVNCQMPFVGAGIVSAEAL